DDIPTATWKVIVLSYLRSGSSLTGDIIQQHPDIFYVFEPLKTIGRQFEGLDRDRLLMDLHFSAMSIFCVCVFYLLDASESQWHRIVRCFQEVNSKCRSAKIIAAKTIRLSMRQAAALMVSDSTVKVVHLIRDPRAVIASRLRFNERFRLTPVSEQANKLCSQVVNNINISKDLSGMFPKRILTVRYEDIAESPVAAARQLFNFLGIQITASNEEYIWNITYAGCEDGCSICTVRSNASATAKAEHGFHGDVVKQQERVSHV
ncbi:unnamed protein product, partial [Candidula unifasciata]